MHVKNQEQYHSVDPLCRKSNVDFIVFWNNYERILNQKKLEMMRILKRDSSRLSCRDAIEEFNNYFLVARLDSSDGRCSKIRFFFRNNYCVDDDILGTRGANRFAKSSLSYCPGLLRLSLVRVYIRYHNTIRGGSLLHQIRIGRMLLQFWHEWDWQLKWRRRDGQKKTNEKTNSKCLFLSDKLLISVLWMHSTRFRNTCVK